MIIITQASTNDTLFSAVCFILMHFARARVQAATSSLVHFLYMECHCALICCEFTNFLCNLACLTLATA